MARPPPRSGGVASPCVSICRMDSATGWCEGCLRTLDEIAAWGSLDDLARLAVLRHLPARRVAWAQRHPATAAPANPPTNPPATP
ncbi:MAG TPA: DUF1289 domain-containing protein [Aquabacterium sp.]|nr:DUF1289 domain-containing protein [Aquabacterium sp.]